MLRKSILLFALAIAFTGCKESAANKLDETKSETIISGNSFPKIAFNEPDKTYDFGELKLKDKVNHTFKFKNEGDIDLVILDAKPSCGCTASNYTKTPIKPGEYGELEVEFSATSPGVQQKTVTLSSNTETGTEVVTIKANVKP